MQSVRLTLLAALVLRLALTGNAFVPNHATCRRQGLTPLYAWSLPNPTMQSSAFGSLTNTWYNEVNPTARTTVYNDAPMEFNFVRLGDDWPSIGGAATERTLEPPTEQRRKPRLAITNAIRRLLRGRRRL